jgi:2',3'-cyclic-nucleotide 2'-phosphodiesterase (5'-nucleotidase family)
LHVRPLRSIGVVGAAVLIGLGLTATPAQAAPTTIQILGFNDFHGRLEPIGTDDEGREIGGAAQMAGMIDQLRGTNPNTLVVSAGDNIGASPFISAVQQDAPTIEFLNAIDLTASSIGNHELDKGFADLTGRVDDLADFPYLGANVYRNGAPALPESYVATVAGVEVGFVGVVTRETATLVSPSGIQGLEFRDPTAEANRVAAELKDDGVDAVVLLAHEGAEAAGTDAAACAAVADPATVFGRIVRGASADINAILSGHTHQPYSCAYPVAGLAHPRPVMQTGNYGAALDQLQLTVDGGAVTGVQAALLPVVGYPADPEVAAIVQEAAEAAEEVGQVQVGSITADITRALNPDGTDNRGEESVLGNFIADVQLDQTSAPGRGGAQIAFMNPGGLRADFLYDGNGVVTYAEAATVQPFANDLVTQTMTGAQIKAALEQQWQPAGSSRPFLHLGVSKGFSYVFNPNGPAGNRVLADRIFLNGKQVTPTATYRVTVNSFLASGGDNFAAFADGTDRSSTGDNDLTVLVNYFAEHSPVTADTAERVFTLGQPGAPTAPPGPGGGGGGDGDGGILPVTGVKLGGLVGVGVLLLILGLLAVGLTRRRRVTAD